MRNSSWMIALGGFALGLNLSVSSALAQTKGGTQGGGTNTGTAGGGANTPGTGSVGGNTGRTTTTPTPNFPGEQRQQQPQFEPPRTYFLSGKVIMDDGAPPPEPIVIERVCGGIRRPEAYTDSKGRFSFQLGQNTQMMADASVSSADMDPMAGRDTGMGTMSNTSRSRSSFGGGADARLLGCELRASLAGYRSDSVNLSGRRALDSPDVGTLVLHRLGNVEGTTISATSIAAPKDARKAYEKGVNAAKKQKWPEAQEQLQKAVGLYPKYAAAWYELGEAYMRQNNTAEARKAFAQSLEADPKFLKPYRPMAALALQEKQWQEAADMTDKLLRLDPVDFPDAHLTNAIANVNLRKIDAAEKSAREAVKIDTDHQYPRAEYVLGFILANKQDYTGALQMMRSYLQRAPNAPDADGVRQQISQLEKVSGNQGGAAAAAPKQEQ
ncbi:MAG TPA: tetratricopeptide repeat protein [Bryobacteraceae bacterium]|nr:tetratricopeptide repeat protein [Bryobacteraceae bacterium]